jgi:hypothetical protein
MPNLLVLAASFLIAATAHAQTTVPFAFSAGAAAKASEVNGNFQALLTGINDLNTRVGRLESATLAAADVAGSYRVFGLQTGVQPSGPGLVETITYVGTVTVAANGTYTGSLTENAHDLSWSNTASGVVTSRTSRSPTDTLGGTFALSGTRLTLNTFGGTGPFEFYGAAGARILVGASAGASPPPGSSIPMGTNVLLILVRTN